VARPLRGDGGYADDADRTQPKITIEIEIDGGTQPIDIERAIRDNVRLQHSQFDLLARVPDHHVGRRADGEA
jgi:hypothetical protein